MLRNRGYALLESLLASVILATGLVSVASVFSVTAGVNLRNRQRTVATLLLYDKMEQLQSGSVDGGGLDPSHPASGFAEFVRIGIDGKTIVDNLDSRSPFLLLWQVETSQIPTVTIAVYARIGASIPLELVRATGPLRRP